jgi:hypothetical protein
LFDLPLREALTAAKAAAKGEKDGPSQGGGMGNTIKNAPEPVFLKEQNRLKRIFIVSPLP